MAMAIALLILMVAAPVVHGAQHTVGGTSGWSQSADYTTWASSQTFTVDDTLLFTYGSTHSVDVVSQSDYTSCNTGNAIKSYQGGNTVINLTAAGPAYYICPTPGHCTNGMKLAVTVVAASGTPTTGPATPPPPGTPPSTVTSSPPPPKSGAANVFSNMNNLMLGVLLVVATTFVYMV